MGTVHAKENLTSSMSDDTQEDSKLDVDKFKTKVDRIHIDGVVRTKDDVLKAAVQGIFKADTFKDVILEASQAKSHLESLGAFKEISIFIDTCKGGNRSSNGLEVTFHVLEVKRITGGVNTMIGNNSGSLSVSSNLPNMCGRGEKLQAEYSRGTQHTTNCNLTFMKPIIGKLRTQITCALFQECADLPWSEMKELDRGLLCELAFNSAAKLKHRIRCEGIWRELSCLSSRTAFDVRNEMGHSLKCSLKHSLVFDHRDDSILPTNGVLFKLNQELAGFAGDMSFHKHELELQLNKSLPLIPDIVLQGSLFAGFMKSMSSKPGLIADRFFLGGPLSIRGFTMNGCGPISRGCSLGADSYWAGALHLFLPLPFRPDPDGFGNLFRTHLFINGGDIDNKLFSKASSGKISDFTRTMRLAYGAGIVLRIGQAARFELNYCIPLNAQTNDVLVPGLQFGIGVSFL